MPLDWLLEILIGAVKRYLDRFGEGNMIFEQISTGPLRMLYDSTDVLLARCVMHDTRSCECNYR